MAKTITVSEIKSKDMKRGGKVYPGRVAEGARADIVRGESIRLYGDDRGRAYDRTFKVGDVAEYDSYNLHYLGTIVSITAKTITIKPRHGSRTKRLGLYEFSWRNRFLDLDAVAARNVDVMMHN